MIITIYTKSDCVQCSATCRALDKQGIRYRLIDLTSDPQALDEVRAMGYQQVPVVIAGSDRWSGFRPDKIGALRLAEPAALQ